MDLKWNLCVIIFNMSKNNYFMEIENLSLANQIFQLCQNKLQISQQNARKMAFLKVGSELLLLLFKRTKFC